MSVVPLSLCCTNQKARSVNLASRTRRLWTTLLIDFVARRAAFHQNHTAHDAHHTAEPSRSHVLLRRECAVTLLHGDDTIFTPYRS